MLKLYMMLIYSTEVLLFLSIIPDLANTRVEKFRSPRHPALNSEIFTNSHFHFFTIVESATFSDPDK